MAPQAAMGLAELPNLKMMSKQLRVRREADEEKYLPHPLAEFLWPDSHMKWQNAPSRRARGPDFAQWQG